MLCAVRLATSLGKRWLRSLSPSERDGFALHPSVEARFGRICVTAVRVDERRPDVAVDLRDARPRFWVSVVCIDLKHGVLGVAQLKPVILSAQGREHMAGEPAEFVEVDVGDERDPSSLRSVPDAHARESASLPDREHVEVRDAIPEQSWQILDLCGIDYDWFAVDVIEFDHPVRPW